MNKINVSVLGSTGFAGQELVAVLKTHPYIKKINAPERKDKISIKNETVFLALPHGESGKVAPDLLNASNQIIDLSGDFRFSNPKDYEKWYKWPHPAPKLLPAPYALPEYFSDDIKDKSLVSVPGCYPTAALLAIMPLFKKGLVSPKPTVDIIALSGVSGAGKKPSSMNHFVSMHGNAISYSPGHQHRHVGEIEQFIKSEITFSPVIIPVERGMLLHATLEITKTISESEIEAIFKEAYASKPFVKVLPAGKVPTLKETSGKDVCHIGFVAFKNKIVVVSSLDNLRKGAATQATQAFNIASGFPETTGLIPKVL